MENPELIKSLEENFDVLQPGVNVKTIEEAIRSAVRNINRLKTEDKNDKLLLSKIAVDLMNSYTNQVQYSELRNKSENPGLKVKPEFDNSFFDSLAILKTELFEILKKL